MKEEGVDVDLLAEIGLFGYTPRPADPFIFNHRNIPTAKGLADIEQVLGIYATGGHNSCLGSLGAGQVDKHGNINSTHIPPDRLIVGSGGGNDVACGSSEVLVTTAQNRHRFVEAVPYVTSPGGRVSTLVSTLGVYAKLGGDDELTLVGYLERSVDQTEDEAVREIKAQCGWDLKVAPHLRRHAPPTSKELSLMRMYDPLRNFLEE
jgi:acyl CoA:acetate/3-ketoacid CoA transferase beta subunit